MTLRKGAFPKKLISWADIQAYLLFFKILNKADGVGGWQYMGDLNNVAQTAEDINGGQKIEYLESASLGQGFIFRLTE